jgi:hypothetical protein
MILSGRNANADQYDIGADVAVKVDYFHFTDSLLHRLNAQNSIYVGVEGYKEMFFPYFYLGAEVGWAGPSGRFTGLFPPGQIIPGGYYTLDTSTNYVPLELNAKYVIRILSNLDFGVGGGFSVNYFDAKFAEPFGSSGDSDWLWGGQIFGELNYKYQSLFIGINVKYELTEDIYLFGVDSGLSADNLRIGGQIGLTF